MSRRLTRFIPRLLLATLFGVPGISLAAPGGLDPSFGSGGKVTTAIGLSGGVAEGVAVQSDGKIVVVGAADGGSDDDFATVRYLADGTLDTTFGGNGKVMTPIGTGRNLGYAVAMQLDGKVVVAGVAENGATLDFAVARYHADGTLDSAFGELGKVMTDFDNGDDFGRSVAVQSDGKILVAGYTIGAGKRFAVARFHENGALDTTFGVTGKITVPVGSSAEGYSVALQGDGKIVVAGTCWSGNSNHFALPRIQTEGTLDTEFGGTGTVITSIGSSSRARGVAVQADGKIVAAGEASTGSASDFAVARFRLDGTPDTSFGGTGKIMTPVSSGTDVGHALAVQSDGKIIVAGYSGAYPNDDFALVRYYSDGSLDTGFGSAAKVLTSVGSSSDVVWAVAVQNDGRIVVAGHALTDGRFHFALARYLSTPELPVLSGLSLSGPASVAAAGRASFTATATFSNAPPMDVTDVAVWSVVGVAPVGTTVRGGQFTAGRPATATAVRLRAIYQNGSAQRSAEALVTINGGLSVTATHSTPQWHTGSSYRVNLSATATGGMSPYSFLWDTDGDGAFDDFSGQNHEWLKSTSGGTFAVKVRATDSQGRTGDAVTVVVLNKPPVPNEPPEIFPSAEIASGRLRGTDGNLFEFVPGRRDQGLVVATHGMYSDALPWNWVDNLVDAIEVRLSQGGATPPNVVAYDWHEGADPSAYIGSAAAFEQNAAIMRDWFRPLARIAYRVGAFSLVDLEGIRPNARNHGQHLADWIKTEIKRSNVLPGQPIHLIGHSAGGFVMGECARLLKGEVTGPVRVTMLDTPFPQRNHFTELDPNVVVERYISSVLGLIAPQLEGLTSR
jgi:uncharacterized delta-60 repeat protein